MKMRCYSIVLAVLLLVSGQVMAAGQDIAPEKRAELEKLLELTGALQLGQQFSAAMVTQMTNALRSAHANLPQKVLDILPEVVNGVVAEHIESLKETILHIYDEHLTLEDVRGLNQFYSTDLGRKVIKTLPGIMQESFAVGQKWGQALGPEIADRMRARFRSDGISL
jgi:uncharacterized protein